MPRNYQRGHRRKNSAKNRPAGLQSHNKTPSCGNKKKEPHPNNFRQQLQFFGLQLKDIEGDGNCLFRALGDQLEGDSKRHMQHRKDVVKYMNDHREDFEPFFFGESENSVSFEQHLNELSKTGVHAGNDVLVAFSRLHLLDIVVHQVGKSPWFIEGGGKRQLHIAFHEDQDHYSSIRQLGDLTNTPTKIRLQAAELKNMPNIHSDNFPADENNEPENHTEMDESTCASTEIPEDSMFDPGQLETLITEVICVSGCHDEELIRDVLNTFHYDVEQTVDYLLNISSVSKDKLSSSTCDDNFDADDEETVDSEAVKGATASTARSSVRTKRAKKQLKRERAMQRRRRERGIEETAEHTSSDEYVINGLNVLNL